MADSPAGCRGHAQHRARVVGQRLQSQVEDVAQAGRQRAGRAVRRGQQLLGEERRCPRSARAGARPARRPAGAEDPRDLAASSAGEKGSTSRRSTTARGAPPRPGTGAADGGGAARRCGRCRRAAGARRAGRAAARRGSSSVERSAQCRSSTAKTTGAIGRQPVQQPAQQPEQAGLRERVARATVPSRRRLRRGRAQLGHEPRELRRAPGRPARRRRPDRARAPAGATRRRSARRPARRRRRPRTRRAARAAPRSTARRSSSRSSRVLPTPDSPATNTAAADPRAARVERRLEPRELRARRRTRGWRRAAAHGDYLRAPPASRARSCRVSGSGSIGLVASTVTLVTPYLSAAACARGERKR